MTTSIYVTFDQINQHTGAGQVCSHEVDALGRVTDLKQVLTRDSIAPKVDKYYGFQPFLYDYFASQMIEPETIDFAHFSCSPATAMLNKLRPKKYAVNIVAHDLKLSIDEHEKVTGQKYPYVHNTDHFLRHKLTQHAIGADVVFTPSEGSAKWIQENLTSGNVEVIPHGLTVPDKPVEFPEDFHIAYIGALGPDKGVLYLVQAWSQLAYPDSNLFFFGGASTQMEPYLKSIATAGNYRLGGRFNYLSEIMDKFSVYVHPSVTEGFGMTVTEAMSYGRPVVVTEGTGSSYLVKSGHDGLVVRIRDPQAIADAIQYFKDNPSEIERMGENARETAKELSWDKIERRYEDIYIQTSE